MPTPEEELGDEPVMLEVPGTVLTIASVWQRDAEDAGKRFEHRLKFVSADGDEFPLGSGQLEFAQHDEKYLARIVVTIPGLPTRRKPVEGVAKFVAELRESDTEHSEWLSQSYPLWITISPHELPVGNRAV